jgi:hypothetical protein
VIPDGADVEADDNISTHLSSRTNVVLLDQNPHLRDWMVLQTFATQFPADSGSTSAAGRVAPAERLSAGVRAG